MWVNQRTKGDTGMDAIITLTHTSSMRAIGSTEKNMVCVFEFVCEISTNLEVHFLCVDLRTIFQRKPSIYFVSITFSSSKRALASGTTVLLCSQ